ncbi:MAG: periplasmic heavy metal sensor [Nitrospira sp.]|nr:periplasmic heavy metal sensor [Nitrospira sp.]
MRPVKKRWRAVASILLIVGLTASPGLADQGHGPMGHGGHEQEGQVDQSGHYLTHLLKHAKEFGLTSEQVAKLKALRLDFKRTEARLEADRKVAKLELDALLDDEKTDLAAIQTKVDQLKRAEGALLFSAIKSQREAMALLTADQREKDRAHREQMKREGKKQGGGMGGGGMSGRGHGGHSSQAGGGQRSEMGGMDHGRMGQESHGGTDDGHQEQHGSGDHEDSVMTGGQTHEH